MKSLKTIREEHGAGEFGTSELTDAYKAATPGQGPIDESPAIAHLSFMAGQASRNAIVNPSKESHMAAAVAHEAALKIATAGAIKYHADKALEHRAAAKGFDSVHHDTYKADGTKVVESYDPTSDHLIKVVFSEPYHSLAKHRNTPRRHWVRWPGYESKAAAMSGVRDSYQKQERKIHSIKYQGQRKVNESVEYPLDESPAQAAVYAAKVKAARQALKSRALAAAAKIRLENTEPSWTNRRVSVTVSDPHHPAVSKRTEKIQKFIRIGGPTYLNTKQSSVDKARRHYTRLGYKVHDAFHHSNLSDPDLKENVNEETRKNYDVTVTHHHPTGNTKHVYRVWGAKDIGHAGWIAMNKHLAIHKEPGGCSTGGSDAHEIKEGKMPDPMDHAASAIYHLAKAHEALAKHDLDAYHHHLDQKYFHHVEQNKIAGSKPRKTFEQAGQIDEARDADSLSTEASGATQDARLGHNTFLHRKAALAHVAAADAHSAAQDKLFGSGSQDSDAIAHHAKAEKIHNQQAQVHRFHANRLSKKQMNEGTFDNINARITKHSKQAVEASNRGDTQAQKYHLAMVNALKANQTAVKEDTDDGLYADEDQSESDLACDQLRNIVELAEDLQGDLCEGEAFKPWMASKISEALEKLKDVNDSLLDDDDDDDDDSTEAPEAKT